MDTSSKMVLRNLPLAPRLVLSVFLVSVGFGYVAALVQMHFQHARAGNLLPDSEDAIRVYHGTTLEPQSQIERLLEAPETEKLNGTGQMRTAFTSDSDGWSRAKRNKTPEQLEILHKEREGERLAMLDWIRTGASEEGYDKDAHVLSPSFGQRLITEEFLVKNDGGQPVEPRQVAIKTLLEKRCVDCHNAKEPRRSEAGKIVLDTYALLKPRLQRTRSGGGMSLTRLTQTTHIHLLSFSVLYGLTGLIFSFTSYPVWSKVVLSPLPLAVQLVEIGCWWLARYDPFFVYGIMAGGVLVAGGLVLQITLSLFNMYDSRGKMAVAGLLLLAAASGYVAKTKLIDPYLEQERATSAE